MNVNSILVHCNIIHSSYMCGTHAPVAYNFFPNVTPGQKILESPHNLIYLLSEDRSNIIELSGDVGTLRNVSAYHEPAWHFNAKFVDGQWHEMANVQKATDHGHFLEMKNSAYHCLYDLPDNKVNAIYIVYKMIKHDSTDLDHNYLFSSGLEDNHRGKCSLKDEKTMRVYGVAGKPAYMDISNFPTSYYNPCRKDKWNVGCVVYDYG